MSDIQIDITPKTYSLLGGREIKLGWHKCLGELIDNAFDAQANRVSIVLGNKMLCVEDDGIGCKDIGKLFTQGDHGSKGGLGVYGVGLKDAAIWLWGTTEVHSFSRAGEMSARVDWQKICDSGVWKIHAASSGNGHEKTGTRFRFNHRKTLRDFQRLLSQLEYTFSPAIENGRQITIKRSGAVHRLQAFRPPQMKGIIDVTDDIDGKPFRVRAGIVESGQPNPYHGFTIAYKHRNVTRTTDGCGEYGTANFFGMVTLGKGWRLSRNKTDIVDGGLLAERLYQICEETLSNAASQERTVEIEMMQKEMSSALTESLLSLKKEQRSKGSQKGSASPADTGIKRQRAAVVQPGDKRLVSRIGRRVQVQFVPGMPVIGSADVGKHGALISLNSDNSCVAWARDNADKNTLCQLAAAILSIKVASITDETQRRTLMPHIDDEDMHDRFLRAYELYTKAIEKKDSTDVEQTRQDDSTSRN